jgi:hypothetical protein
MSVPNPDLNLAYCSVCHKLFTLIDMAENARKRGLVYPNRPDRFVIECDTCKTVERISDPDLYFRTVAAIQRELEEDTPAN